MPSAVAATTLLPHDFTILVALPVSSLVGTRIFLKPVFT